MTKRVFHGESEDILFIQNYKLESDKFESAGISGCYCLRASGRRRRCKYDTNYVESSLTAGKTNSADLL